ncbi:MAG: helix-turn-helix transcriptional regulator [bacterium]|nr:helix-turn-helix transcriptional regulator [bacterium]
MVYKTEVLYKDIGIRLRNIRQEIRLTMDGLSKETEISRSYLSDFEKGFRMPTAKYLSHLHDRYKVNLNYIFGGEGRMFRAEATNVPDFAMLQGEVDNMLRFMGELPAALYAVLGFAAEYEMKNKTLIDSHRAKKSGKTTTAADAD